MITSVPHSGNCAILDKTHLTSAVQTANRFRLARVKPVDILPALLKS